MASRTIRFVRRPMRAALDQSLSEKPSVPESSLTRVRSWRLACRWRNYDELHRRRHCRRQCDRHAQPAALASHRPGAPQRVLDVVERGRDRAGAECRVELLDPGAAPVLRYVEEQILGGNAIRELI